MKKHSKSSELITFSKKLVPAEEKYLINYAQSIEEMQETETDFVPENVILEFRKMMDEMPPVGRLFAWFLWHSLQRFSISLILLFVAGKITSNQLVECYMVFFYAQTPEERDKIEKEYAAFLENRLNNLKELQEMYG